MSGKSISIWLDTDDLEILDKIVASRKVMEPTLSRSKLIKECLSETLLSRQNKDIADLVTNDAFKAFVGSLDAEEVNKHMNALMDQFKGIEAFDDDFQKIIESRIEENENSE